MPILTVPVTTSFTGQNLLNITQINMTGAGISASFAASQFGPGKISTSVIINNVGTNDDIVVSMSTAGTFSAAGWTFLAPVDFNDQITINGSTGVDTIIGSSGRDVIGTSPVNLAAGADHLFGGDGDDILSPSSGVMAGAIYDGGAGLDVLRMLQTTTAYDLRGASIVDIDRLEANGGGITVLLDHTQVGAGAINKVNYVGPPGGQPILIISGGSVNLSSFDAALQTKITITGAPVLASTLIGSNLDDKITGGNGADTLGGGNGADSLFGGRGNDTFLVDNANTATFGDIINGGQGFSDRLLLSSGFELHLELLAITGVERLQFGSGAVEAILSSSQILGPSGIGTIVGGVNLDEIRIFGSNMDLSALAFSNWTAGVDRINLEGTSGGDTIVGTTQGDVLDGKDFGTAVDTLTGGAGNDVYKVDNSDIIIETAGQGFDTIAAYQNYILAAGIDIEALQGRSLNSADDLDLTGNALVQTITGTDGINRLDSGGGVDTLIGLLGGDVYFVRTLGTIITETAGQGTVDIVRSNVSFALAVANDVEQMSTILNTGTTAINLTGNGVVQIINGNAGANRLDGRGGSDRLNGLAGADTFIFSTALAATNVDTIGDYSVADDKIQLKSSIFTGLANGALLADAFKANNTGLANDDSDRIIYEKDTGFLFFDADGTGAIAGIKFAILTANLVMVSTEFEVA